MSHFFWQSALQSAQQQQQPMESGTASQNDGNWSKIGLVGGAEHERQQWPLQNTQYSELGADPYSAAVFQSYNNSASGYQFAHPQSQSQQYGNGNHQNNFYGAAEEDAQALYHNQMSAGITTCEHGLMNACENVAGMVSNSQSAKQQQFQQAGATISGTNHPQQSFGIHEPILPEPRSPVESVNQAENVLYNAVKRDSVDSRSASSKGWSVEREQSSLVEATNVMLHEDQDGISSLNVAKKHHQEQINSVQDSHAERNHSEPPMLQTQVPDLLNIGEMASKGLASCEMIVEKKDEAICALSNVPVDADFRPHEGTSSVNQHSRGDMVQVQNREAGSISGAGNVTEQQPLVEECAPAFSATVNSTEQRVAYGAEAGKQADQVKSVQRGVEGSEKIVSVPGEAANIMPHAEWESTHSPVAVAQVTPMMAAPHSNAGAEQVPQGPLAETVPQQQQHSMPQTAPVAQPPSLSSAVAGANVARVGPISSQPVEPQVASMPCVPPTQQQNISADDSQQLTQSVVLQQTSAEVTPSTGSVTAVEAGSTSISVSSVVSAVGTSTTAQSAPLTLHNSIDAQHESTILGRQGNESSAAVATAQSGNAGRLGTSHVTRSITVEAIKQGAQEEQRSKAAPWAEMVGAQHPNTNPKPNYYEAGAKAANEVAVGSAEHSTDSAAQEVNAFLTDHAKVAKKGDGSKKSVRERYRFIREQYPEVMKRLDRHRTEMAGVLEWRGSPKNVLLATANANFNNNPLKSGQHKSSTPKESESTVTVFKHPDISAIDDRPSSKMSHSYTLPENIDSDRNSIREVDFYGDDFVNTRRRSRYARTRERAPSRGAKSDMGEVGQYGGLKPYMKDSFYAYDTVPAYSSSSYAFNYYPSGRHSLGPVQGGYSQDQYGPYATVDSSMRRRPQSSFDARAYSRREQANSHYGVYDAYYGQRMNEREREGDTSETDEGSIESDDEMAQIHHQQQMMRRSAAMYMGAGGVATDPEERYYLGVIQLPQERARQLLYRYPPPADYFHLPAIERVAYLFYCALYRRHFQPVDVFHKRFNREYYNYTCDGDSSEIALWKICKHTQDEFNAKRSANQLKAYEMSQKQLFSDERETPDSRVSDRGSRCEHEEDSDRLSVDSALREPLKFRSPHSFVRFGVGGKVLVVDPGLSVSVVEVRDLKALVRDTEIRRVVEAAESFKGPLVADFTPTHSVRLYVQRQIERILKSDAYRANPSSGYANDALLVWQLLEMVVQQQGRVTGPDLSRLLMAGSHSSGRRSQGREKNSPSLSPQPNERIADPRAYERFTHFLLGGHIDEAIDSALKDGLYADALVLARRVCAHDPRKLDKVEAAFLAHRADQNPVMTLLSVASDMPAPILTNPPTEDSSSWRSHAAVVLANLSSPTAFNTVYHLGRVLARREYHAAADFCFLAVNLLAGYDPFQPVITSSEEDGSVRQHITLIHASVPHDETDSTLCRCRFSLADLHATEIFEYAVRLASSAMPTALSRSLEYQMCKLDYAEMISECGGFSTDAFRYCIEVARAVWDRCAELSNDQLTRLCDLADRLQFVAGADASEVAWIPIMRSVVDKRCVQESVMQPDQQQQPQQTKSAISAAQQIVAQQEISQQNQIAAANYTQSSKDVVATTAGSRDKERTVSLSSEAADWHADHQEPLQMAHVEEPISELPSTQQQRAVESKQQAPAAVGRSGSEHRQHHLLRQRRPSGNAANATANASYAFPPSMPGAGELPTLHQQMPGSRSASISECALQAPSTGETAQQISKQQNAQGYAIDEGRDSYAKNAAAAAATGSQPRATFWQGDTPDGDAPLSSVEPSTGTTTSTEESTTTASNSADGSPCRQSSERQHSSTTVVTNMSSYSTINDSVFTAGVADSFRIPSDDAAKSAAAPPKPHLASYEEPPPSASMPVIPTPASDHTMVEQQPKAIAKSTESAKHAPSSKGAQHGGILSMLKAKIAKAIPTGHEMILPDDTNPSIVWDPVLNKYVGAGVEEEIVSTPPPSAANSGVFDGSGNGSTGGLRAARVSGGSRYFNPLNDANSSSAQTISKSPVPMVTMPIPTTTFGFIPSMPDDDDGAPADSPFSVNTAPAEPAVASAAAQ